MKNSKLLIIIAIFSFIAKQVSANDKTSECKDCTQKQLHTLAHRLIAYSKHANESRSKKEYESLKHLILTPEMKCEINKIEAYSKLLGSYATLSEERKLDLPGISALQYCGHEYLLLKPSFVKSSLYLNKLSLSGNKAEVIMLRRVCGDDKGKVWRPYQEELVLSFECVEGRWILQDILFKDLKHPSESFTLKWYINKVTQRQAIMFKEWEPRVKAALYASKTSPASPQPNPPKR
jgi:hypothetical protein